LTGSDLAQGLHQALYRADLIPILPQVSAQIRRRDDAARALVATFVLDGLTQSLHNAEGLEGVVNCADRQRLDPTGVDIDVDTILAATPSARVIGESYRDCDIWKVASAPAAFNTIPRSSLPTLALAGEYDPITPPEDTERVAKRFAGSTFVLFPGLGHGEIFSHDCPRSILKEFLDDPTVPPDLTCVKAMGPPAFTPG
jgi:pimeloyl-ACP methyl ester carboxylesterase